MNMLKTICTIGICSAVTVMLSICTVEAKGHFSKSGTIKSMDNAFKSVNHYSVATADAVKATRGDDNNNIKKKPCKHKPKPGNQLPGGNDGSTEKHISSGNSGGEGPQSNTNPDPNTKNKNKNKKKKK